MGLANIALTRRAMSWQRIQRNFIVPATMRTDRNKILPLSESNSRAIVGSRNAIYRFCVSALGESAQSLG
jgi:hypothetical protein